MTEVKSNTPLQDFPGIYNANNNELLQKIENLENEIIRLRTLRNNDVAALSQKITALEAKYNNTIGEIKSSIDTKMSELETDYNNKLNDFKAEYNRKLAELERKFVKKETTN